jgi:uncharacterized cupin superfamily protein
MRQTGLRVLDDERMNESCLAFGSSNNTLELAPINSAWILEGTPIARNCTISTSKDGTSVALIWDCTAGRFNWFYDVDETVYVIEGSVLLKDANGAQRRVSAGDTVHFPVGAKVEWTVDKYIRKVAFCAAPMPKPIRFAWRGLKAVKRLSGLGSASSATAMFGAK